eukprot:CAMPEP_0180672646 /NCGR_PEP_ID=MMETSP1037_2-20121125/65248_1 /TAXON_ID=632150 /ORGANISM="Azadinium spinosum, Strain 3D9" /LENGTH=75 /DNA_ID=CAMNT_0022701813 /DNA_START=61 /DNA_END=288 /DNA_ORIENTATION=-
MERTSATMLSGRAEQLKPPLRLKAGTATTPSGDNSTGSTTFGAGSCPRTLNQWPVGCGSGHAYSKTGSAPMSLRP